MIDLGYKSEDLFGKRLVNPVASPQLQVPVDTDSLGELCEYSAETLHTACKIPPSPVVPRDEDAVAYDAETLRWVLNIELLVARQFTKKTTTLLTTPNLFTIIGGTLLYTKSQISIQISERTRTQKTNRKQYSFLTRT